MHVVGTAVKVFYILKLFEVFGDFFALIFWHMWGKKNSFEYKDYYDPLCL